MILVKGVADAGAVTVHAQDKPMAECHIPSKASRRLVRAKAKTKAKAKAKAKWKPKPKPKAKAKAKESWVRKGG